MTTTFSLKQGETRSSSGPIPRGTHSTPLTFIVYKLTEVTFAQTDVSWRCKPFKTNQQIEILWGVHKLLPPSLATPLAVQAGQGKDFVFTNGWCWTLLSGLGSYTSKVRHKGAGLYILWWYLKYLKISQISYDISRYLERVKISNIITYHFGYLHSYLGYWNQALLQLYPIYPDSLDILLYWFKTQR